VQTPYCYVSAWIGNTLAQLAVRSSSWRESEGAPSAHQRQQQEAAEEQAQRAAAAAGAGAEPGGAAQRLQAEWEEELEEASRAHQEEVGQYQQALERSEKELLEAQLELRRAHGEVGRARDALGAAEQEKHSLQQELTVQQSLLEAAHRDLNHAAARLRQREESLTEVLCCGTVLHARPTMQAHLALPSPLRCLLCARYAPALASLPCAPGVPLVCP